MTRVFGGGYPPPGNGLPLHGGPMAIRIQRCLVDAGLLDLQLAVLGYDPEVDQVFFLRVLCIVELHVGKKAVTIDGAGEVDVAIGCLLYTSPSPRDRQKSRMP